MDAVKSARLHTVMEEGVVENCKIELSLHAQAQNISVIHALPFYSSKKGCSNVVIGKAVNSAKKEAKSTFVKRAIRALVTKGFLQPKQPNARLERTCCSVPFTCV